MVAKTWRKIIRSLSQNGLKNVEDILIYTYLSIIIELTFGKEMLHINEDFPHLAYGPDKRVTHYEAFIVNGLCCHTRKHEIIRTQNFGVVVKVEDQFEFLDYYSVLTEIIQVDFLGNHQVVVFKQWHRTDIPSTAVETNMGAPSVDNSSTFIDEDDNEVEN
ncbi:transposon protein, partial [Striga asiatica]